MRTWSSAKLRPATRAILEQIANKQHDPQIRSIILFGSEARGEAHLASDIDIALVSDEPLTRAQRLAFTTTLDDGYPEVRVINTLTAHLNTDKILDVNYHIKREGLIIYER
ncbi:MAG: nucleotidyltransferase domain-containing protein [Defluviitaleaceae bacterium]|nr:nucleotidyltransferase domain-containing protein [Defluviitaleaceae bacterium]